MHIRKLELKNVRQFGQKTLTFQPGFNLIVGENGAGKSTVLRSIMTALKASGNFRRTDRLSEDDIRYRADELRVDVELQDGDAQGIISYSHNWRGRPSYRGQQRNIPTIWFGANEASTRTFISKKVRHYSRTGQKRHWDREFRYREEFLHDLMHPEFDRPTAEERARGLGRSEDVRRFVEHALSTFSRKFSRFAWRLLPYDCVVRFQESDKLEKREIEKFSRIVQGEIMRFLEYDYPPRRYLGWGTKRIVRYDSEGYPLEPQDKRIRPMHEFREIFKRAMNEFPGRSIGEKAMIELKLDYRIIVFGPEGPFYLSQLSDGEKRIFSMIVDIAQQLMGKDESWREIRKRSACILIDEIDCHLHPRWQRTIVKTLEDLFPSCQFVATTHSPFVIQAIPPDQLHSLSEDPLPDFTDKGIEEIAFKVMHIDDQYVSPRYFEMLNVAREYYRILDVAHGADASQQQELKRKLRELSGPYVRNPAFQAFLEMKGEAILGTED